MRTGSVKINDKEYTICLSTRVLIGLEEKGLSLDGVFADTSHQLTNLMTLLSLMIDAGYRWQLMKGADDPEEPLTFEQLMDSTAIDQYAEIVQSITATVASERKVEATPPKRKAVSRPGRNPQD